MRLSSLLPAFVAALLATPAQADCLQDFDASFALLRQYDAGAETRIARDGPQALELAIAQARDALRQDPPASAHACTARLNQALKLWRHGHLGIVPGSDEPEDRGEATPEAANADAQTARLQALDARTLWLRLPSFEGGEGARIDALLKRHARLLQSRAHWVLDLRGNGGGVDDSYRALLGGLQTQPLRLHGMQYLADPALIEAHGRACDFWNPGNADCERELRELQLLLRAAPTGSWVGTGPSLRWQPVAKTGARFRPQRIAVLIDGGCASSCEELVLALRQLPAVKVLGARSHGALDLSNLRPFPLPSGRQLLLTSSRSARLPDMPIDAIGIQPDLPLPSAVMKSAPEAAARWAAHWLKGGSP